jgi:membrane protein required for colicin V production
LLQCSGFPSDSTVPDEKLPDWKFHRWTFVALVARRMTQLIWVDYAILSIVGISALISILRGFVKEALSVLGWIVALWVSLTYCSEVATYLVDYISVASVRTAAGFLVLFTCCLLVAGIINFLAGKLVESTGLTGTDRMLGVIFGVVRGALIVCVLVLLAGFTEVPKDPWWAQSVFIKHFQPMAVEVRALLPAEIASGIAY